MRSTERVTSETTAEAPGSAVPTAPTAPTVSTGSAAAPAPTEQPGLLALVGARLISGTGAPPVPDTDLLLAEGRILRVGPTGSIGIPAGAQRIPCAGLTALPGFIDSHTHVEQDVPEVLAAFLQDGVTSIGNTGCGPDLVEVLHRAGRDPGAARAFVAGPAITAPGGYPVIRGDGSAARGVSGEAETIAAVDELADLGVDFIKLTQESFDFDYRTPGQLPVLAPELIAAAARRARERGLPVRSHVHHVDQLDVALAAGVSSVEHLLFPLPPDTGYVELQRAGRLGLDALPEFGRRIDRMVAAGVRLVPTVGSELISIRRGLPELPEAALREIEEFLLRVLAAFQAAGGQVVLGSDWVGLPGIPAGLPRQELGHLLAAGLTPLQVIEAGTRGAAAVCGQAGQRGVLAPGLAADLILVEGDPSTDLGALDALRLVIKAGRIAARGDRRAGVAEPVPLPS